jgi:hypothetical protein
MGAPPTGPTGTSYGNPDAVIRQLRFVGIKHIRDTLFIGDRLPSLLKLNRELGIKADLGYDDYRSESGIESLRAALANVRAAARMIEAFEGPNEPDQFGLRFDGLTGAAAVHKAQRALYTAVKEDRTFLGIPIFCPALSFPAPGGLANNLQDMSEFCDFATSHDYVENLSLGPALPLDYLRRWTSFAKAFVPGRPHVITEGGWATNPGDPEGVDESTQATYLLTYLLDAALLGISRTYIYDLADDGPDPAYQSNVNHYGMFRYDGTPKPAARMLAALNSLLAGKPSAGNYVGFRLSGFPQTGHSLTFRRAHRSQIVALWNESYLWDRQLHQPRPAVETPVQIEFATTVSSVRRLDIFSDTAPQRLPLQGNKVSTLVPDHPIFLEVEVQPHGRVTDPN